MEKYKKYYGVIGFAIAAIVLFLMVYLLISPSITSLNDTKATLQNKTAELEQKQVLRANVERKKAQLRTSLINSQKKIYSPVDTGLEQDTLFFTLYNDVIEMLHGNSVRIKSIDYTYNPASDVFVENGKDIYFVCDVNMELVSNYVNLGKFIQDIYQYPYYIRINEIDVKPYAYDKKILISNISLRLYAHTVPDATTLEESVPLEGAETALPQQ